MSSEYVYHQVARNMGISEFADRTGVPVATIRDWNKRGLSIGLGQPGPNKHWLYSRSDVAAVLFANVLRSQGYEWDVSLATGIAISKIIDGRNVHPDEPYYQGNYMAFGKPVGDTKFNWAIGKTEVAAINTLNAIRGTGGVTDSITHLINLEKFIEGAAMNPLAHGRDCVMAAVVGERD